MSEAVDRRYLAAVRFVDAASGSTIQTGLTVESEQARFFRNRSGLHVVARADGLDQHDVAFEQPPTSPDPRSVEVQARVVDGTDAYLARRFRLELPRSGAVSGSDSLFQPVEVPLYPSPRALGESNWAAVRATLRSSLGSHPRLSGALARVVRESDGETLGTGMSELTFDPRRRDRARATTGELLVFVPGIPVTLWGEEPGEPVLTHQIGVRLEVVFDPDAGSIPDPDLLAALPVPAANRWSFQLAAGRAHFAGELNVEPS
jgi:hypothetical protein